MRGGSGEDRTRTIAYQQGALWSSEGAAIPHEKRPIRAVTQ